MSVYRKSLQAKRARHSARLADHATRPPQAAGQPAIPVAPSASEFFKNTYEQTQADLEQFALQVSNDINASPAPLHKAARQPETVGASRDYSAWSPARPAQGAAAVAVKERAEQRNVFVSLLHELTADRRRAIAAIRGGLPATLLKDIGVYFDLPAHRIRSIVRVPETTAHALVKRGAALDAAASERIWRLADLAVMAQDVFQDEAAATMWLRSPNRAFRDEAPMDLLDTEPGAMSVRQVLNAIATGGAA